MLVTDDLLTDLSIPHELDVPLGPLTWFGIGGSARILAHPQSPEQLSLIIKRCRTAQVPVRVIGAGANLLVADEGVDGVVVALDAPAFKKIEVVGYGDRDGDGGGRDGDGDGNPDVKVVRAGAGVQLFKLSIDTVQRGLGGLEVLAGVPATVGGAIRMNAGGTYGDIGRVVKSVTLMDSEGEVFTRDRSDLIFSYRTTNIAARFILEAQFELTAEDPTELSRRYKSVMAMKQATQPLAANSAGCTFKNPPDDPVTGEKRPAGKLIDMADLKRTRIGGAEVSDRHANFIICHKGCTATDVIQLIAKMRQVVLEKFGVDLEREVVIWPG